MILITCKLQVLVTCRAYRMITAWTFPSSSSSFFHYYYYFIFCFLFFFFFSSAFERVIYPLLSGRLWSAVPELLVPRYIRHPLASFIRPLSPLSLSLSLSQFDLVLVYKQISIWTPPFSLCCLDTWQKLDSFTTPFTRPETIKSGWITSISYPLLECHFFTTLFLIQLFIDCYDAIIDFNRCMETGYCVSDNHFYLLPRIGFKGRFTFDLIFVSILYYRACLFCTDQLLLS